MKITMDDGTVYDVVPEGSLDEARAVCDRVIDERNNAEDRRDPLAVKLAEVERLRAAQQLPDVGPVTREGHLLRCDGDATEDSDFTANEHRGRGAYLMRHAARRFAFAAFLDAEADTSGDDEPCARCGRPGAVNGHEVTEYDRTVDEIANKISAPAGTVRAVLDAHRVRGGQVAGRDR